MASSRTTVTRESIELSGIETADQISTILPAALVPASKPSSVKSHSQPLRDDSIGEADIPALRSDEPSKFTTVVVITLVTMVNVLGSMINGFVTVAIPVMAVEVDLAPNIILWPASVYSLVCGCTLLLAGSISDVVGARFMYLLGCFLQGVFNLASGLSRNGGQLIAFRALSGLAISCCLPSAVSVITNTFPPGQSRNIAFASMGGGQPIGFGIGLIIGGVLTDTIGWRSGFWMTAGLNIALFALSWKVIPRDQLNTNFATIKQRLYADIDWVGALLISSSLAMISYTFAAITTSETSIKEPANIALLTISLVLLPCFHFWVARQERLGRPALIPPSLWRSPVFTSICICVFMTWGGFNAVETLLTFYFQSVQLLSPLQASIRFLAAPVSGLMINIAVGLLVNRVRGDVLVGTGSLIALASPILLALAGPETSYWKAAFPAIVFNPAGADVLFTVSNLVITERFPSRTQGLAGGVFQTVSQIGKSVGLALAAVVANSVTEKSRYVDKESPIALMEGYKAAFWFTLGLSAITFVVGVGGLRKVGKVGLKRE